MSLTRSEIEKSLRALFAGLEDFPLLGQREASSQAPSPFINKDLKPCTDCGRHRGRRQVVEAQIIPGAKLCVVGGRPLEAEDQSGKAFQGPRGELLEKMLAAIGIARHQASLLHIVKCFSPTNESAEEVEACYKQVQDEIRAARPQFILAMGESAARALIRSDNKLGSLRGRRYDWDGIPVFATHEVETLLLRPELKKEAWADLQILKKEMEK